jgi:hypothetical protein
MSWVRRNELGRIEAASVGPQPGYNEEMPDGSPELRAFIENTPWPPPVKTEPDYWSLAERRARRLERKGDRLGAITLRTGG